MTNQKLVLDQITALNTTTANIIDSTGQLLRDNTARIPEQAAGATIPLTTDPATGEHACAAFWPTRAGWHLRRDGEREHAFLVRTPAEAPGLHAAQRREETERLAGRTAAAETAPAPMPGPRWPWLLAWLLLAGGLWWFERSRRGRA